MTDLMLFAYGVLLGAAITMLLFWLFWAAVKMELDVNKSDRDYGYDSATGETSRK